MKKVVDIQTKKQTINDLIKQMSIAGGFSAKHLATSVDIVEDMIKDKQCLKFLSFPACITATGTRGVIRDCVKEKYFDVIITTCGTLDHDLARSFKNYYEGRFLMDDKELHRKNIHRLGNVLVPIKSYGIIIEKFMTKFLNRIYKEGKKELSTYEFCWELGKEINNKDSILYWAYKNKIPVVIPGITDGAVGYQLWQFYQDHDFKIDVLKDETLLSDLIWNAKKSGAVLIGGGISKHHTIWWNQFRNGLDYAVYLTTAVEWDGSLSGARPREAISWSKIKEKAKMVTVNGDATISFPLIISALKERLK
ncbi:MAG: deoxyhypusine synthase [Candidatus Aenigmarchaeota archaeon]|nr:deoxyhypusine synthase [Candidatus Aenigmarchaeota archaeon]